MSKVICKVLIVDDEKGIAQGLTSIIDWSRHDCEIVGLAHNGQAGFELAMSMEPEVIVTDIRMPRMDGLEMIRLLKDRNHPAKFIILSGFSEFEYAKRGMQLGINHYVLKPVEETELEQSIAEITAQIRAMRPGPDERKSGHRMQSAPKEPIDRINDYIERHFAENITLFSLSELFFLNPNYLSQLFKKKNGETFIQFLTRVRMEKAMRMLAESDNKIHQICLESGYSDIKYFRQLFEKHTGQTPGEYRIRMRNCDQEK